MIAVPVRFVAVLLAMAVSPAAVRAQCANAWLSCGGQTGIVAPPVGVDRGVLAAIRWDPDGAGPAPERLVFGGNFTAAGGVPANNIAQQDLATGVWSPLGSGVTGVVRALVALPNGELVAGGTFTAAGGVGTWNLARWNGSAWAPVDANGVLGTVTALAVRPNGSLVVLGDLTGPGWQYFALAEWNGSAWTWHGGYPSTRQPRCLQLQPNGDLLVGTAGSNAAEVLRWNGASWSQLGATFLGYGPISPPWITSRPCEVRAVAALPNGELVAAGAFSIGVAGGMESLAHYSGGVWTAVATPPGAAGSLLVQPSGHVVLAGGFGAASSPASPVQVWDGATTTPLGAGLTGFATRVVALPNGDPLVAGEMQGGAASLMRWDGAAWSSWVPTLPAIDMDVRAIGALASGDFVVAGRSVAGAFVARRVANAWQALPGLPAGYYAPPTCVLELANGDLLAGGPLGVGLWRWNGTAWTSVGYPGTNVTALARLPGGDVVVAGDQKVHRWNGSAWSQLGAVFSADVLALAVAPDGAVYAGGSFTAVGPVVANRVARWHGGAWSAVGSGIGDSSVFALLWTSAGDLVAGGTFQSAGGQQAARIARWNGNAWSSFAAASAPAGAIVRSIAELPGGDLAIGGAFPWFGAGAGPNLARWNGNAWQALGSGFNGPFGSEVFALATLPQGELLVGGDFTIANGLGTAKVVRVASTCPASVGAVGVGCAGSGGANTLVATTLPWAGGTWRAEAGGMPAFGLCAAVYGLAPLATPLAALLPQGLPGCSLLATPDLDEVGLPNGGLAATALAIPDTLALAGTSLRHQVIAIELAASGAIVALSSTPALQAAIGVY